MAVFRVEKVKDYTIMSNHHLRNVALSLKAKGLMSLMLSLPEDWDYTLKGLACICRDGVDSISRTIKELEDQGYLTRRRFRYPNGRLGDIEYTIHEQPESKPIEQDSPKPESPKQENPVQVNSIQENPTQGVPMLEKPVQLNTNQSNTKESITKESIDKRDKTRVREYRELIQDNIEYDILVERYGAEKIDALVELMLEVVVSDHPYCVISRERLPREVVRSRFLQIDSSHIEFVLGELEETTRKVGNTRAYVLAALFNAPVNMDNHYLFEVNHDYPLHGRKKV